MSADLSYQPHFLYPFPLFHSRSRENILLTFIFSNTPFHHITLHSFPYFFLILSLLSFSLKREIYTFTTFFPFFRNECGIELSVPFFLLFYYMLSPLDKHSDPILRQHIWRQRQLDIFFRTGRPIFNIDPYTIHIRSHYNPGFFQDPLNHISFFSTPREKK